MSRPQVGIERLACRCQLAPVGVDTVQPISIAYLLGRRQAETDVVEAHRGRVHRQCQPRNRLDCVVGDREHANQYSWRHAVVHSARRVDAINATGSGEPQLSIRGLDRGRQRSQHRSTADDAVEGAERFAVHAISGV